MVGPINRVQPSEPGTVNTLERYGGHLIKVDSEGGIYWSNPETGASTTWTSVEACRADIDIYMAKAPVAPVADMNDVDVEVA